MTIDCAGPVVNGLSSVPRPFRGALGIGDLLLRSALKTVTVAPDGYPWIWVFSENKVAVTNVNGLTYLYGLESVHQIFPFIYLIPDLNAHFRFDFEFFVKLCTVNKLKTIKKLSNRSHLLPHGEIKATDFFFDYLGYANHAWTLKGATTLFNKETNYTLLFKKNVIEIPGAGCMFYSDALALNFVLAGFLNVSNKTREALIGIFASN